METFREVMQYGWPTVALAFVAWGMWRVITFLGQRLFDDEHGLVTTWVASQVAKDRRMASYLDAQEHRDEQHVELCAKHASRLQSMSESMDRHGAESTLAYADLKLFRKAALEGCQLLRKWSTAFPDQQSQLDIHTAEIERIIREAD